MLKIKVKAGSITNLTDARYFAAREVEWLGFPIGAGEGLIEAVKVKAIAEWVDGVKIVGEFPFSTPEEIRLLSQQIGLDAVQVGMFISPQDIAALKGLTVIKEVVISDQLSATELEDHLAGYTDVCDFFLLNFSAAGLSWKALQSGHPYSIDFLKNICQKYAVILNLDFHHEEVTEVIRAINPLALAVSGGEEERVGVKSFDQLDEMLDMLEIE